MLDFNNVLATPGADIQYFEGTSTATLTQWQVWKKPRGVKWIYLLGVGGGASGGTGINTTTTSGGGAGGCSGGQSSVMIPAMFVPDVLYVQAGAGGQQPAVLVSGAVNVAGLASYVCISPYTSVAAAGTILLANGGQTGIASATSTTGGTATVAASAATLISMCLAGRGFSTLLAGVVGAAGGAAGAIGTNITPPSTGLMVTGGAGGGGTSGSAGAAGGNINTIANMLGTDFFTLPITAGVAASGATPAGAGGAGLISRNFLMNFGGAGGGGATDIAGGTAGAGGAGAPGCGGGGGGGMNTTNTTISRGGDGGPGFVYIISI